MKISFFLILFLILVMPTFAWALHPKVQPTKLTDRLAEIRYKVDTTEKNLLKTLTAAKQVKGNIKKIQVLIGLQKEEQKLSQDRITELETTIGEMAERRGFLNENILIAKRSIRSRLRDLYRLNELEQVTLDDLLKESEQAPLRYLTQAFSSRHVQDLEALKVDLQDIDVLEIRIHEEQNQLAYLINELKEKEAILTLNKQLQADLLKQKFEQRLGQWEHYQQLKSAQSHVEDMMSQFQARKELESTLIQEKFLRNSTIGEFAKLKGNFRLPVLGTVVGTYGKAYDSKSNLMIFKKGIDIAAEANSVIKSIFMGKVAFAGELPDYGRVTILDHGDHFYTLMAHMGELKRKTGDLLKMGEEIGRTDDAGTPIYFEIRSRNVALNPLQWILN